MIDIYDLFSVKGKKALVTGASSPIGIGYGCGEALIEGGAQVAIASRPERIDAAAEKLGAIALAADLSQKAEAEAPIARALQALGGLDILVNNAGISLVHSATEFPFEDYRDVMTVNVDAVFILSQAVGRHMLEQGRGKIINIASMNSFVGGRLIAAYAASKAAVEQLTKALADEWAKSGVKVNAIAPGYIRTELTEAMMNDPELTSWFCPRIPADRWGEPADLQGVVIYLSSAASDYVHGTTLIVDGGFLAR